MDLKRTVNSDPRRRLPPVDRLIRKVGQIGPDLPAWAVHRASKDALEAAAVAYPIVAKTHPNPASRLNAALVYADAWLGAGVDRAKARALVIEALGETPEHPGNAAMREQARSWLDEHR